MNLNNRKFKTHALVTVLFLLLAVSLAGLMYGYWSLVIQPRLYIEAESNAKILAESQARMISGVLSSNQDMIVQEDINELSDQVLVFIDPLFQQPYFLGISLELDNEVVAVHSETLDLSAGDMQCQHCFFVSTALYSQNSYEVFGIASFALSDVFYEKLKTDIKQVLLIESSIALAALFLVWVAVSFFISRLTYEIKTRKKMTHQLQLAKEGAEKSSQTKSDFLANMSHEIRTPLNAIIGMNYILSRTSLDSRQQDLLRKLGASSRLLLSLINDLLDFSKIEAGKLELESTTFQIDEVLDNLAEMVMTKAGEKGIDILYSTSRDIPHVLIGDPLRLGQILLNLLNNALKFTVQGEILLTVQVIECSPSADCESICLQFSVKDSGIGIKPEDIAKLFHSFTQADNSTTRKFGGTGLGLSICKQLVKQMGGEISVVSTYGEGSTFTFTVNLRTESRAEPVIYHFPESLQRVHVLVIDDNPLAQNIFQHMLDCFGFKVSIATSAQQGIKVLQHYCTQHDPVKLILMDWKMPGMNGVEASRLIKTQLGLEIIPAIIMVTAYDERLSNAQSHAGWDDYLVKPVSQSVLYDAIINIFSDQRVLPAHVQENVPPDTQQSYSTKQVLLTEDNLTNQEVACALLAELDIQVSIANNGKEAVAAVKSKRFDLIFMDLQMPEMDGFEATRLIRSGQYNQHVPIIAMTAHAMQGDREKCLNAQMSDYITKPIDVDNFFALLKKWFAGSAQQLPSVARIETENKANSDMPVLKSINIPRALVRMRGKQELLMRLLINFKRQKADLAQSIGQAMQIGNVQEALVLVHSLKGEAGTLEANTLFMTARDLEQQLQLRSNTQQDCLFNMQQALAEVCQDITVLEGIWSIDNASEQGLSAEINMAELTLDLRELSLLLQGNNLRAKKLAKKISPQLNHSQYAKGWDNVLQALAELNFEIAQVHLQALATDIKITL